MDKRAGPEDRLMLYTVADIIARKYGLALYYGVELHNPTAPTRPLMMCATEAECSSDAITRAEAITGLRWSRRNVRPLTVRQIKNADKIIDKPKEIAT